MKALEERILKDGKVLPGHVLKVGSFLNQQMDVPFVMEMGQEIARLFAGEGVTKVVTVEASGIAIAFAAAAAMGLPMVFAKKHQTSNLGGEVYSATVHSYTHNKDYEIVIAKDYISKGEKLLIVDDFLANGCALRGLIQIAEQAGAEVAGLVTAIEKGFQGGGDALRKEGYRVEALALIDTMNDDSVTFRS